MAYCLLDAAGTFADSLVLERLSQQALDAGTFATLDECSDYAASAANCAYELTFLFAAVCCFVHVVLIRKQKLVAKQEAPKYLGAAFETAGQFAYIFCTVRHGARRACSADHFRVLRGIGRLEPHFPEGKARGSTMP